MPAGLSARQQRVLRGYDDWLLVLILTSPDDGIRAAKVGLTGRSRYAVDGVEYWMQTTKDGIRLTSRADDGGSELLTWAAVRAHACRLDPALVRALREASKASEEHDAAWRPFAATGAAVGCGRRPVIGPLTYAQYLYGEQYAAWDRDVNDWRQQQDALEAEREALLDRCLPLAHAGEPPGLFEQEQ